ncbi:MAG: KEOPS complex kinase/ATPase Bud32 [Candidatus Micrarchaeota archaeon]
MSSIFSRGAEAILTRIEVIGIPCVRKERIAKTYRVKELDQKLRKTRTRSEARLLHKAKLAGVLCPTVLEVEEFALTLSFIEGERPEINEKNAKEVGELLAKLHNADIIHGDFTLANLIASSDEDSLYVIDFGLGFFSNDVEDKAIDVYTMIKSLSNEKAKNAFTKGYEKYDKYSTVFKRLKDIEKRVRYAF